MKATMLLLFSALAFGQGSRPTQIGEHRMGETWQEWLAAEPDLNSICQRDWSRGSCGLQPTLGNRDVGEWMREMSSFDACQRTQSGNAKSCKDLSSIRDGKPESIETIRSQQTYVWEFLDGKLARLAITDPSASVYCNYRPDIEQLLGFLVQKYGKPTESGMVGYQNAFGAKWDLARDTWNMPDGTGIIAAETLGRQCDGRGQARTLDPFPIERTA